MKHLADFLLRLTGSALFEPIIGAAPAIDAWFYDNFGIRTTVGARCQLQVHAKNPYFDDLVNNETEVIEFRSAERCELIDAKVMPMLRCEYVHESTGRVHECYPVATVKYGIGYLIIIGMTLKSRELMILRS